MMNDSTLIKFCVLENCVSIRTISRKRKSPQRFLILKSELERFFAGNCVVSNDIHSFAKLVRDPEKNTATITFTWLDRHGNHDLIGYDEIVHLPYDAFQAFVQSSREGAEWSVLSMEPSSQPRFCFADTRNLKETLRNGKVRRKLSRFLRDNFHWSHSGEIWLGNDFLPYSFTFQEYRDGKPYISGGLIFHIADDMDKAYYAIHT